MREIDNFRKLKSTTITVSVKWPLSRGLPDISTDGPVPMKGSGKDSGQTA